MSNKQTPQSQQQSNTVLSEYAKWAKEHLLYTGGIFLCIAVAVLAYCFHSGVFTICLFSAIALGGIIAMELHLREAQRKLRIYRKQFGDIPDGYIEEGTAS